MKKLYQRLLNSLNISGRDLTVFVLALLLAFSIWMIHNLSLKYAHSLVVNVVARCNIEGHSNVSSGGTDIAARCKATGYGILKSRLPGRSVQVEFKPSVMRHKEDDLFYVLPADLTEYSHLIFGDGATLEYFESDTVFFRFPEVDHKKVPVQPVSTITFADQHMAEGQLRIYPDSVSIYGESHRLETIEKVFTEHIKYSSVSSDIHGIASLEKLKDVRISVDEVKYILEVSRFVEITRSMPVNVVNAPADSTLQVFPSSATVTAKFVFPLMDSEYEKMDLQVDYKDYALSLSGKCPVKLTTPSKGLITYDVEPAAVSCVMEARR